jgi:hypothetical protein
MSYGRTTRRVGVFLPLALALLSASLFAERPDVTAKVAELRLPAGGQGSVLVELNLGPRWHVNSHTPTEDFLVPTDVTLATTAGEKLRVTYPKAQLRRFSFSETPLSVYAGKVHFEAELALPPGVRGRLPLTGEISYQACTDEQCFPPARISLSTTVEIR